MRILQVFLFVFIFLLISGCPKKEDVESSETVVKKEIIPTEKMAVKEKINLETDSEITDEHFKKGSDISSLKMVSLTTGELVSFSDFKGKIIVVDFWSSWCVPCIEMFPVFNELKEKKEDNDGEIKVVSVNLDPLPAKAKKIMKEKNIKFEVLKAPESLINAGLLLPFTAISDKSGKIVLNANGKHTYQELLKLIEEKE
jgi:thiol-disulfide isomerase/thioredoxin